MLKNIQIGLIHQELANKPILDLSSKINEELDSLNLETKINSGDRVAITAGSRGINNIDKIVKILIKYIKSLNADPFIFPAMGSHGGATAEGQIKILQDYGISEESMDAPIMATMEVKEITKTKEGLSIYIDKIALEADHIIVVNRIKPHTKWKGSIESGLCKMMAIGMGKHVGAQYYHKYALQYGFPELLEIVAQNVIEKLPILFGLAIVEDGYDQTSIIEAIEPNNIIEMEKILLLIAKENLPKIPFKDIDILIIDEIGKEISGGGMDFNVIGRNRDIMNRWHSEQKVKRLFVRDITENSMGNGLGIGMADFTTEKLVKKLDLRKMYINALTSSGPENAAIPMHFPDDKGAIEACLNTIGPVDISKLKLAWVKNTLSLEKICVSEALYHEAKKRNNLSIVDELNSITFDKHNNLVSPFI